MSKKIAISKIEIRIGKNVLKLSLQEMKELKEILDETFPEGKTVYNTHNTNLLPSGEKT